MDDAIKRALPQPAEADMAHAAELLLTEAGKARAAADHGGWRKDMQQAIRARANGYEAVAEWLRAHIPPEPSDATAFLDRMLTAAHAGERVTAEDVARLRRMADWADAPPPAGWNGTLDKGETQRAVDAAKGRMR